jgi:hypothetical protein
MISKTKIAVLLTALVAIGMFLVSAPSAFADESGRCGGHVSTGQELFQEWQGEGVTSPAAGIVKSAGYHAEDDDLKSWMTERVVKAKLAASVTLVDYGCHPGEIFGAGTRHFAKGVSVMVALPHNVAKSDLCSVKYLKKLKRLKKQKKYKVLKKLTRCERREVTVSSVGKVNCSNPLEGKVTVVLYVKVEKERKRHGHRHGHHKTSEGDTCSGKSVNNGNGSAGNCNVNVCVGQNNCNTTVDVPPCTTCGPPPVCTTCGPPPCTTCEPPKQQPPIVTNLETINDMLASRDGQHYKRTICFEAFPAPGGSLSDLEVVLRVENGEVFGSEAEYRGGNKFCQLYESPSETGTETYWGWARDKKTGLTAESEHKTFPVKSPPTF